MKEMNFQEKAGIYNWFKNTYTHTQIWEWLSLTKSVNLANFMHLFESSKNKSSEKIIFSIVTLITID